MSEWHCRLAAASSIPERCEGPGHGECGLRYAPGEYTITARGLSLPGIGTIRVEGIAFAPRGAGVIVYQDGGGWTAEFDVRKAN
jgi:hypothetical protein